MTWREDVTRTKRSVIKTTHQNTRHQTKQDDVNYTGRSPETKIEDSSVIIYVRLLDIVIPDELNKPTKVSLKFILNQGIGKVCAPIVVTSENVLIAGIRELKVAKLLGWARIPAIIQGNEESP